MNMLLETEHNERVVNCKHIKRIVPEAADLLEYPVRDFTLISICSGHKLRIVEVQGRYELDDFPLEFRDRNYTISEWKNGIGENDVS